MSPAETIRRLAEEAPDLLRLAEEVSLAVQVDPALLRRARLDLGPRASAGTEADLWFSPLVRSRSPAGFVLMPELAAELRRRLAHDPVRLATARARVERAHANLPPALRLEEELLWLSVRPDGAARRELEERFRIAVAALVRDGRHGIAHWAARALPALPTEVQCLEPARILDAGARLQLKGDGGALASLAEDPTTRSAGWLVPFDFPTTAVHVRLLEDGIELAARAEAPGHVIQVPSTDPLLIEVHWKDAGEDFEQRILEEEAFSPTPMWILIVRGAVSQIAGPVGGGVRLRTISGHTWDVRPAQPSPRALKPSGDLEALFLEHLGWINRVSEMTCTQYGVRGPEAEDFAASVRLKIMEDDYAILRNHRGESSLKTYLATVVQRKFLNHVRQARGRWRPSVVARRLGPPAPDLEALVHRDGYRLDQAGETLRTSGRTALSDRELGDLLNKLPPREPLRHRNVSTDEVPHTTESGSRADDGVTGAERRELRARVTGALERAMARLAPEDQIIVRMHDVEGRTLADVARALKIEQKSLYRRAKRLRELLRAAMEADGVTGDDVWGVMEGEAGGSDGLQ